MENIKKITDIVSYDNMCLKMTKYLKEHESRVQYNSLFGINLYPELKLYYKYIDTCGEEMIYVGSNSDQLLFLNYYVNIDNEINYYLNLVNLVDLIKYTEEGLFFKGDCYQYYNSLEVKEPGSYKLVGYDYALLEKILVEYTSDEPPKSFSLTFC